MFHNRLSGILLWVCIPLCTTVTQTLLKLSAGVLESHPFGMIWLETAALTPYIWGALFCEIIGFIAWIFVLKSHNLGIAFTISSASYILVILVGYTIFHETLSMSQVIGLMFILSGLLLISRSTSAKN